MNRARTLFYVLRSLMILSVASLLIGCAEAQHVEIGAFGDYENSSVATFPKNAFGAGARIDINLHRLVQAEFDTAYDVKHAEFVLAQSGASAVLSRSKLGILHLDAGLKVQTRGGSFFLFVKGGANRYDPERTNTNIVGTPVVIS